MRRLRPRNPARPSERERADANRPRGASAARLGGVSGLVSNLETVDEGEPCSKGLGGAVDRIFLSDASLTRTGSWRVTGDDRARLAYEASAGGVRDLLVDGGEFDGRLLGRGDAAGQQVIGTWAIGTDLAGGFGANLRLEDLWDDGNSASTAEDAIDIKMSLATMFGDGYPILVDDSNSEWSEQQFLQGNHRSAALGELTRLRNTLQKWVAFDDADASGDDMDLANDRRLMVLNAATDVIDEDLFGRADDRVRASSGTRARITASPGDQTHAEGAPDEYPGLSGDLGDLSGRPQDAAVLSRLDAVIEALSDEAAFADAFDSGGVFSGTYATDNADLEVGYAQGLTPGQTWKKAQHRIDLLTDRRDVTRFGVGRSTSASTPRTTTGAGPTTTWPMARTATQRGDRGTGTYGRTRPSPTARFPWQPTAASKTRGIPEDSLQRTWEIRWRQRLARSTRVGWPPGSSGIRT